jgi:glyoxylase-like metal-dependent hydrolase (beta-lactamase superfamily II)
MKRAQRHRLRHDEATVAGMDVAELVQGLYFLRFPVGHLPVRRPRRLDLIDTSVPGSASQIRVAIYQAGHHPSELRQIVLTHFHAEHAGAPAEIAACSSAEVATSPRRSCAARNPSQNRN